jgi:hypothetical protein
LKAVQAKLVPVQTQGYLERMEGTTQTVLPGTEALAALRAYSAGQAGTRRTLERLGLHDYADLVIALAQHGLDFPKPAETPSHTAQFAASRAILGPLLRRGQ